MLSTSCHCTRLRRAAHVITRRYDDALAASGLTVTQFSLMRTICRLEQPYISVLAEAVGLERSTLGRNLRPLEKSGLIEFGQGHDARAKLVRLSRKGQQVLDDAVPQWRLVQEELASRLGEKKLNMLENLLADLIAG